MTSRPHWMALVILASVAACATKLERTDKVADTSARVESNASTDPQLALIQGSAATERGEYAKALQLLLPAAENGIVQAQFIVGGIYGKGSADVPVDYSKGVFWTRKAADQGHAGARFNLARFYQTGQGVPQDYTEARRYYQLAAQQQHAFAFNNLGSMYKQGLGVVQDYGEASRHFRRAGDLGLPIGYFNLAELHKHGLGMPKNESEAMALYRKSAEAGWQRRCLSATAMRPVRDFHRTMCALTCGTQ